MNSQLRARGTRLSLAQRLARHRQMAVLQRPSPPVAVDQPAWRTAGVQLAQAKPYSEEVSTSVERLAQPAPQSPAAQAFSTPEAARGGQVPRLIEMNPVSVERSSTPVERSSTPVERPPTTIGRASTSVDKPSTSVDKPSTTVDKTSTTVEPASTSPEVAPITPVRAAREVQRTPDRVDRIPTSAETGSISGRGAACLTAERRKHLEAAASYLPPPPIDRAASRTFRGGSGSAR